MFVKIHVKTPVSMGFDSTTLMLSISDLCYIPHDGFMPEC